MSKRRTFWGTLVFSVASAACGGGDAPREPVPAQPWSLEPSVLELGGNDPFCQQVTADIAAFMAQFEGEMPPSDAYGGTAVVGNIGEIPQGMNGLISSNYTASQHQAFVHGMTLIRYDENLDAQPYLARSWEFNDDQSELTFHLRDDVYWHDGELTDAYDVAFTYEAAIDPDTGFPNGTFWALYDQGPNGVEVIDSFTVKFRMTPQAEALDPWRTTMIMPEHLLGDVERSELGQHPYGTVCPVGNGPFIMTQHRQDASWSFQANPAFPEGLGGRPYLDRYVYRTIQEQNTLLSDLLTEAIDVYISVLPDQAERVIEADNVEFRTATFRQYNFVGWNSRRPQLADKRVRQALTMGTNREELVEALVGGYGTIAHGSIPDFHWAYNADVAETALQYDPDAARALLDEAGWTDTDGDGVRENADGVRLSITLKYNPNDIRRGIAEIMQQQLAQIGVEIIPEVQEFGALIAQVTAPEKDFDALVMGWVAEFKLDDRDLFHSDGYDTAPYAWSGTRNPDMDRLIDDLARITDRDEAIPLWAEYQRVLSDEAPYTFVYYPQRLDGVNLRLKNVEMDVRGEWISIRDWQIAPEDRRRR